MSSLNRGTNPQNLCKKQEMICMGTSVASNESGTYCPITFFLFTTLYWIWIYGMEWTCKRHKGLICVFILLHFQLHLNYILDQLHIIEFVYTLDFLPNFLSFKMDHQIINHLKWCCARSFNIKIPSTLKLFSNVCGLVVLAAGLALTT